MAGSREMIKITKLTATPYYNPSAWEGYDTKNRPVYVRYRGGELRVFVGEENMTQEEFDQVWIYTKPIFTWYYKNGKHDGYMTTEEMRDITKGFLDIPENLVKTEPSTWPRKHFEDGEVKGETNE
jgi:hypothetical protein